MQGGLLWSCSHFFINRKLTESLWFITQIFFMLLKWEPSHICTFTGFVGKEMVLHRCWLVCSCWSMDWGTTRLTWHWLEKELPVFVLVMLNINRKDWILLLLMLAVQINAEDNSFLRMMTFTQSNRDQQCTD